MTLFDVGALLVDEGARRYPTGTDVGRRAVNEHRSWRMLWSVTKRLFGLPNSFPTQASAVLRFNPTAATDLNVRLKKMNTQRYGGSV